MPIRWAVASGNFSNLAIWNDSASLGFPTASDDIWANNNNINIDQNFSVVSLNNTSRSNIATPQMTSNTTPIPYVIAASSTDGVNPAWAAFNRNNTTDAGWVTSPTSGGSGSLSVDFGVGNSTVIDGYTMYGGGNINNNPARWTFEASNNAVSWTILQTVTSSIGNNGSYSATGLNPSTAYRYYRINISAAGGVVTQVQIRELELYQPGTAALAAGGSFIFNSGSISGSATSTTAALTAGAIFLVQVTATTGSVSLNVGSSFQNPGVGNSAAGVQAPIAHTGNCNFILTGPSFEGNASAGISNHRCIAKSSTGTITINGNLIGGAGGGNHALTSTGGNTVVIGNVSSLGSANGITQTLGNITITGNVAGSNAISLTGGSSILTLTGDVSAVSTCITLSGASSQFTVIGDIRGGSASSGFGISHSGTSGSVIGNITGGSAASAVGVNTIGALTVTGTVTGGTIVNATGINTSNVVSITGNVVGSVAAAISTTNNVTIIGNTTGGSSAAAISTASNISMNVTGTATATAAANAISSTSTGTVLLTGNMINVAGKQAIFAQNLFISDAATTQWRLFTPGGQDKTLYSADTFPNQPTPANVRSGSLFGPSNVLSGSMVVPSPSDVRVSVLTDNTVGTGQSLTAADFLAAISASADPYAERLRNVATVDTVGSLLTGFNNGGF
jgi:hypothetical protein